jgi:hypothetical protein
MDSKAGEKRGDGRRERRRIERRDIKKKWRDGKG